MTTPSKRRLLAFARELQRATTVAELVIAVHAEIVEVIGYRNAWLYIAERENPNRMHLIDIEGAKRGVAMELTPVLDITEDPMLAEIGRGDAPVVVDDAREDPRTNKELVAKFGNRTIVNIPLRLVDQPLGVLGTGTFGDEGVHPPTADELDYLLGMASQVAVATSRIRLQEERRESEDARRGLIRELEEKQERLREAVRARDEFLSIASHELKTPLMSLGLQVESAMQLVDAPDSAEKLRGKLASAKRQVTRLTALINKLLDVTRITSEGRTITCEPVDMREVVAGAITALSEEAKRVGSTVELSASAPVIGRWDRAGVDSVVYNLLTNAIKYGRGQPIAVEVDVEGDQARLCVTDRGIGIAKEEQERIFHRFERAVLAPHVGGLGLGLWIVRQIIEAHGGTISVASKPAIGSIFTVLLPLTPAESR